MFLWAVGFMFLISWKGFGGAIFLSISYFLRMVLCLRSLTMHKNYFWFSLIFSYLNISYIFSYVDVFISFSKIYMRLKLNKVPLVI